MKKLNSKLYDNENIVSKTKMSNLHGGANASDVKYTDTKISGGQWDVALPKYVDIETTSRSNDKPISAVCLTVAQIA